ncbi:hypothetical protein [Sulfurovum sp. NBC37-1]|uniref:hypothetical protein n=1 Tax=Sulfurovum sp. (strain NBC37-1) TaxID=387093 RepID=UPI0001587ADF|nr:hypothetical protein [Sulfurovum sp. NBC37-1]BAF72764.1 conserved hypothetical protein [Sulfurovum sp. NBC37-1]
MSHRHKNKIEKLFTHPISNNVDVKKLLSALEHYGFEVDITKKHKAKLFYNEKEFVLALPHGDHLSKDEVVRLKHFLEEVGITPDSVE